MTSGQISILFTVCVSPDAVTLMGAISLAARLRSSVCPPSSATRPSADGWRDDNGGGSGVNEGGLGTMGGDVSPPVPVSAPWGYVERAGRRMGDALQLPAAPSGS